MLRIVIALALLLVGAPARAGPRWQNLPPTPAPVAGTSPGRAAVNGIRLYYATIGRGQPRWTGADLKRIRTPVLVADGDHGEGIKRAPTEYLAASIPGAGLLILPNVSHFAFLQDPALFNAALLAFLDGP